MPGIYWWPIAGIVLLTAYELYAAFSSKPKPRTLSQIIWRASGLYVQCPMCDEVFRPRFVGGLALALGFGAMVGHFFL